VHKCLQASQQRSICASGCLCGPPSLNLQYKGGSCPKFFLVLMRNETTPLGCRNFLSQSAAHLAVPTRSTSPSTHRRPLRPTCRSRPATPCSTPAASRSLPTACSVDGGRIHHALGAAPPTPPGTPRTSRPCGATSQHRAPCLPVPRPVEPSCRLPAFCHATRAAEPSKFYFFIG
jgi:hypothetical protein